MSSWDSKCDYCRDTVLFPVQCKHCGGVFCSEHLPPKKHRCPSLRPATPLRQKPDRHAGSPNAGKTLSGSGQILTGIISGKLPLYALIGAAFIIIVLCILLFALQQSLAAGSQDPIIGTWKGYEGFTGVDSGDTITFDRDGTFYNKKFLVSSFDNPYITDVRGNWTRGEGDYYILTWKSAGTDSGGNPSIGTFSYVGYDREADSFVFTELASLRSTGLYPPTVVFKRA